MFAARERATCSARVGVCAPAAAVPGGVGMRALRRVRAAAWRGLAVAQRLPPAGGKAGGR